MTATKVPGLDCGGNPDVCAYVDCTCGNSDAVKPSAAKVYVLEVGVYDGRYIAGVYATPEAAMAAHQPTKKESNVGPYAGQQRREHTYTWSERGEFGWSFDADWDDAADITEYEVGS